MSSRVFLYLFVSLSLLATVTSPALLGPFLNVEATPTATVATPTPLPTASHTPDLFADIPTATPISRGRMVVPSLPTVSPAAFTPTFTSSPTHLGSQAETSLNLLAVSDQAAQTVQGDLPAPPTPSGPPPDRVYISRLNRELPIEVVDMIPSSVTPGIFEWGVPDHRAAGWLNSSALFGAPGNTVLDGHHNIRGEAFRDLWTLQAGDEIILYAGGQSRSYLVGVVLILPERDRPLEVRLANAHYIQPTSDERLTLITCWPYESNTHRVVVIAFPKVSS